MKKDDVRKLKLITLSSDDEFEIPHGWQLVKDPTKITENGVDVFKAVIGHA